MSKAMDVTEITQELFETVLSTFNTEDEKETARQIVKCFVERGLPVKVKQYYQPCMEGTYRILCFIKKSAEAVIINNKGMGHDGVSFQVRIEDRSTLDKLDSFGENIRNQILNSANCGHCSAKCDTKKYVFVYQNSKYIKCHFLCSNFTFKDIKSGDIDDLITIVNNEITNKHSRRK